MPVDKKKENAIKAAKKKAEMVAKMKANVQSPNKPPPPIYEEKAVTEKRKATFNKFKKNVQNKTKKQKNNGQNKKKNQGQNKTKKQKNNGQNKTNTQKSGETNTETPKAGQTNKKK